MSLYNLLHGVNPLASLYVALVGLRPSDIPRFRDCYLFERSGPEAGNYGVAIYTRTGGGNRECYCHESWARSKEEIAALGDDEHFDGCYSAMNAALARHPLYLRDEDDDFDCTYATFYFRVPAAFQAQVNELAALGGQTDVPAETWQRTFRKLSELQPGDAGDEETRHWVEAGRPIIEAIVKALTPTEEG